MIVKQLWTDLDTWLAGEPDTLLRLLLIATAIGGIVVAMWGPRPLKAALLLYWWFP